MACHKLFEASHDLSERPRFSCQVPVPPFGSRFVVERVVEDKFELTVDEGCWLPFAGPVRPLVWFWCDVEQRVCVAHVTSGAPRAGAAALVCVVCCYEGAVAVDELFTAACASGRFVSVGACVAVFAVRADRIAHALSLF